MSGDVEQDSRSDEEGHERRSTITDERKGNAGKGDDIEIDAHIDECLNENGGHYPYRDVSGERVVYSPGDPQPPVCDVHVTGHEYENPDESQFFRDYGKYEVALDLRKVAEFLNGFSKTETEETSTTNGYETLLSLKIDCSIRNGRLVIGQEIVDPIGNVRKTVARFPRSDFSKLVHRKSE